MKKYIESIEDVSGKPEDYQGDFIKEEIEFEEVEEVVGGKKLINRTFSKTKQTAALNKVKLKEKSGKKYKRRIHICNHEEGQPCTVEEIK